ncbi:TetR/AcrR family transcriptional regulator [Amycolatopsis nigrescens]|uniref:TetR/AcrR family transcriptional regulator n=1 Tax=Amycolatopsis nigrescens TaxID=381445 RepID=UPI0003753E49|nr:TetR/AcrR family transcriptional regulator [Amycolatopsis nigrescens]
MVLTGNDSRERVRRAAVKLFADKGFHGTGIRDLASAAKLSSASLYHYMGTKEELLAELMDASLRRLVTAADEVTAGVPAPAARLSRLVALHVFTHALQPDETKVVDNEVRALSPAARRPVVALRDGYEARWASVLEDGVEAGVFDTDQPSATRLALLEMCNGVARWYSPRGKLSLDELAAHYARLAGRMLGCEVASDRADLAQCRAVVARVWGSGR